MSKYEELSKLKELLDAGVLSKEEFEAEKKKILDASEEVKPTPQRNLAFSVKKLQDKDKRLLRNFQKLSNKQSKVQPLFLVLSLLCSLFSFFSSP